MQVYSARTWLLLFGGFGSGVIALLEANHRQSEDSEFFDILSRIRLGCCTDEDIRRINSTGMNASATPRSHTVLCLMKHQVDSVNMAQLARLPGHDFRCYAHDTFLSDRSDELQKRLTDAASATVVLKSGCKVFLTRKVGNALPGTRVIIISLRRLRSIHSSWAVKARIEGLDRVLRICPMRFDVHSKIWNF